MKFILVTLSESVTRQANNLKTICACKESSDRHRKKYLTSDIIPLNEKTNLARSEKMFFALKKPQSLGLSQKSIMLNEVDFVPISKRIFAHTLCKIF